MGQLSRSLASRDLEKVLRAQYVASGAPRRAPEMVVKLISSAMERDSARNMVYYIGRLRQSDREDEAQRVTLYHADGQVAVEDRGSFDDARKAARSVFDALAIERAEDLEAEIGYNDPPLMHHLTASFPIVESAGDIVSARMAAASAISEAFEASDYPVLWAMHNTSATVDNTWPLAPDELSSKPHGHVHIHILVRTRPEEFEIEGVERDDAPQRLSFDREDFAALRALFAAYGQMNGLEVEATRPIDRVSEMIAREQDLIREQVPASEGDLARRDRSKGRLSDRAPDWNPDVIDILYDSDRGDSGRPRPEGDDLDRVLQDDPAAALFQARFEAAELALLRWRLLRRELVRREGSAKLADWYLEKRPEVFGEAKIADTQDSATEPAAAPTERQRAIVQSYDDAYEGRVSRYEDPDGLPSSVVPSTRLTASSELPDAETAAGSPSSRSIATALASLEALAVFSERRWPKGHPLGATAERIRAQSGRLQEEIAMVRGASDGGVDFDDLQRDQSGLHGDGGGEGGTGVETPDGQVPSGGVPPRAPVLYEPLPAPAQKPPTPKTPDPKRPGRSRRDDFDLGD